MNSTMGSGRGRRTKQVDKAGRFTDNGRRQQTFANRTAEVKHADRSSRFLSKTEETGHADRVPEPDAGGGGRR